MSQNNTKMFFKIKNTCYIPSCKHYNSSSIVSKGIKCCTYVNVTSTHDTNGVSISALQQWP